MATPLNLLRLISAKPANVLALTICAALLNLQFSLGENSHLDIKNFKLSKTQLNCGRVISSCANGESELFLGYKYNQPVDKWERCSWIVAIPNATGFIVEPVFNGLKNQAAGLNVLGINHEDNLVSYNL